MLSKACPKLPMCNKSATLAFYENALGFILLADYDSYLILSKDSIEIHFFLFKNLMIDENYGQVYIRVTEINTLYNSFKENGITIHPNGHLEIKPWGQKEFSILDPDNNLLTFGENVS